MDLRSNQDDRPYRVARNTEYGMQQRGQYEPQQQDDVMSMQGYYRERLRNLTEQRWFPLVAVSCCVILFGGLIAFAYRQGASNTTNATTPLIQAENTPYKEKPQDPGGMDVPFQDAVVFDQLDNAQTAASGEKIENLLPPPEQPIDEPAKVADAAATTTSEGTKNATETAPPSAPKDNAPDEGIMVKNETAPDATDSVAAKIAATEDAMKTKTEAVTAAAKTVKTETVKAVETTTAKPTVTETKTAEVKPAKVIPVKATAAATTVSTSTSATTTATAAKMNAVAPAAPTPAPVSTGGSAKVQLGAFKDETAARAAWAQFQKTYAPHLNGITPNYARADLGAKGVFYRVQGVNLSKAQAQNVCKSINAMKPGSCLIPQ